MDEVWLRLGLIGGALLVAGLFTIVIRWRSSGRPRTVESIGLDEGVYLFTSAACPDCSSVRRALRGALGEEGFVELSWEEQPGLFHRLGIDAVPATMIVDEAGSATLWPGRADEALESLGP